MFDPTPKKSRSAAAKGKARRIERDKQRSAPPRGPAVRRDFSDVPATPSDGKTYVYPHGGRIVDKGLMRWRFDNHGKLIAWFLYAPEEDRARGAFPWVEIWTDGKH